MDATSPVSSRDQDAFRFRADAVDLRGSALARIVSTAGDRQSGPESDTAAGRDVAEEFFPAETDRMGVKADALALVTMLIGLVGAVVFISVSSRPDLWPPPAR